MVIRLFLAFIAVSAAGAAVPEAELVVQMGNREMRSASYSPDGRYIVTAGDNAARLWLTETREQIGSFDAHSMVFDAAFLSPTKVAVAASDGMVRFFDVLTKRETARFSDRGQIATIQFSKGGIRMLANSWDVHARVWEVASGKVLADIPMAPRRDYRYRCAALSPDGNTVLTCGDNRTAQLWDASTGKVLRSIGQTGGCTLVAFSSTGRYALIAHYDWIELVEIGGNGQVRQIPGGNAEILSVAFSPDDRTLIINREQQHLRIWDPASGISSGEIPRESADPEDERIFHRHVASVAFSPDGRAILTATSTAGAWLWDAATGSLAGRFVSHTFPVGDMAFSRDGRTLLSLSSGGTTAARRPAPQIWDLESGSETLASACNPQPFSFTSAAFSDDGQRPMFATGMPGAGMAICDVVAGKNETFLIEPSRAREPVFDGGHDPKVLLLAPDGRTALYGGEDNVARLADTATGRILSRFDGHNWIFLHPNAPDGAEAPYANKPEVLQDYRSFKSIVRKGIYRAAFSPNSGEVATAGDDRAVRVWSAATGREISTIRPYSGWAWADLIQPEPVRDIAFSPDGKLVATVTENIDLWDKATGKLVRRLGESSDGSDFVLCVAFSPDGRTVATGGWAGIPRLWDVASGRSPRRLSGQSSGIVKLAFSPDGKLVATGGDDGLVRFWSVTASRLLVSVGTFDDGGWAAVDPEGRYDASDPNEVGGLIWVAGERVMRFEQMKSRFYTPNLLARVLGYDNAPLPPIASLHQVEPWPSISIEPPAPDANVVRVNVVDNGGGIGKVVVKVNGRDIETQTAVARGQGAVSVTANLDSAALRADGKNTISAYANGRSNLFSSPEVKSPLPRRQPRALTPPSFWAILVGVSSYPNDERLTLRYAARDALELAEALRNGAGGLFGGDRVHITTLASGTTHEPTKAAIRGAFESVARTARSEDVVFVYLAGHGIAGEAGSDTYYFLPSEARASTPLEDKALMGQTTISSAELRRWLTRRGMPLKEAIVLDTCAAGGAFRDLSGFSMGRGMSADQRRALELLHDATNGTHILMAAAADSRSYENEQYLHSVLAYALLVGMRGEALEEGGRLQIRRWFDQAGQRTRGLAKDIGETQTPYVSSPSGQTFPIALFSPDAIARIVLSHPRPQLAGVQCLDESEHLDSLHLTAPVGGEFRARSQSRDRGGSAASPPGSVPFVYSEQGIADLPGMITPQVLYNAAAGYFRLRLIRNDAVVAEQRLEWSERDPVVLARHIVDRFTAMLSAAGRH